MIGTRLSHYLILERLGEGGMGVVYRARDERLGREVAIKVLPEGALDDEEARQRFRREARTLSRLAHPNIAGVHDFDSQEGTDFLVLELVPGETLSDRVRRGPLPEGEIAHLGVQLAEGLEAAHEQGILHRDIKPANLRVTPKGVLKILDFGLAKRAPTPGDAVTTESVTLTGHVAGTVPYMSPEQLRGEALDGRCDLYAAGAVLYETAVGVRAFPQEPATHAIGAILHEAPVPPRELKAGISVDLERIILRCLEKDRARRYASCAELAEDLRRMAASRMSHPKRTMPWSETPPRRRSLAAAVSAVTVGVAALLLLFAVRDCRRLQRGAEPGAMSLAVLPLANLSGDSSQEFFADGMTDELISTLSQVGAMRVISRTSSMQYKGTKKPIRLIARELGVRMIVEGSVLRAGNGVRVTAQLIDAAADRSVWSESYEGSERDVLRLQRDVARSIVDRIAVKVTRQERRRLATATVVNPEAYQAYLRGRAAFSGFGADAPLEWYQRAIGLDPQYAAAYAGLAEAYMWMSGTVLSADEAMGRARAAATRALEIDPNLPSAHAALAYVRANYEYDRVGAEKDFRRALALNPGDLSAHQYYGALLVSLGRFDEALEQYRIARAIDPLSSPTAFMSLTPLFEGRRYGEAIAAARSLLAADPKNWVARMVLAQALFFSGSREAGIAALRNASEEDSTNVFLLGWLGYMYGAAGDREKALGALSRLERIRETNQVQPYLFAIVHVGLGESDQALDLLERAVDQRSEELLFANVDPVLDPLRGRPRFRSILKRLRFL